MKTNTERRYDQAGTTPASGRPAHPDRPTTTARLGGYLVARAAAFEHRVAALILDDGIHDFHAAFAGSMPPFIRSWIEEGRDDVAVPVLTMIAAASMRVRWGLCNGMWVFGAESFADLIRKLKDYSLERVAHQIMFDWLDTTLPASPSANSQDR